MYTEHKLRCMWMKIKGTNEETFRIHFVFGPVKHAF